MASANQLATEERLVSPMSLRVDSNAGIALEAVALIFCALGGVNVKKQAWTVAASLPHPEGVYVSIKVVAYSVEGEKTYLDVQRCNGDAIFGGRVYGLLSDSLAAFKSPSCFKDGHLALPRPPGLKPADDPIQHVPSMSLNRKVLDEVAWSTVDGIAAWSPNDIHHFKVDHDEILLKFQQGKLPLALFEAHFQKVPVLVRQGLKPRKSWKHCLPSNCGDILEKISMLIAEGEMYHTLHL